jgi:hypothetical protein
VGTAHGKHLVANFLNLAATAGAVHGAGRGAA